MPEGISAHSFPLPFSAREGYDGTEDEADSALLKFTAPGLFLTLQSVGIQQMLHMGCISLPKKHRVLTEELGAVTILGSPAQATHASEIDSSSMQTVLAQEHVSWR